MKNRQLKCPSIEPCVLANAHNISELEAEVPKVQRQPEQHNKAVSKKLKRKNIINYQTMLTNKYKPL